MFVVIEDHNSDSEALIAVCTARSFAEEIINQLCPHPLPREVWKRRELTIFEVRPNVPYPNGIDAHPGWPTEHEGDCPFAVDGSSCNCPMGNL